MSDKSTTLPDDVMDAHHHLCIILDKNVYSESNEETIEQTKTEEHSVKC